MPDAAEAIRVAKARLASKGIENPRLDAEVLLRHVLRIDRTQFFMRLREPVDDNDLARFETLIERRLSGEPIAYITGVREFMGSPFEVGPGVLIPRPETEEIVEWAATWLASRPSSAIVDVGTGSGAIILSLALAADAARGDTFLGCDRSSRALEFAVRNRGSLGLDATVRFVRGDLLTWLGVPVDLVLANLPYLRPEQVADNPEIQAEPEIALISGDDGFDAISELIADLPRVLKAGGSAMFELDPVQADRAADLLSRTLAGALITVIRDLAGLDRYVLAEIA